MPMTTATLTTIDLAILLAYVVMLTAVGVYFSR